MTELDASRVVDGKFAKIMINGEWQTNATECTADVEIDKKTVNACDGSGWEKHKKGMKKGKGTIKGYKVTSKMIQQNFEKFEVITSLEDPEAYGYETIRLKNCMQDKIQLVNVKATDLIEEEIPFTFSGYELLNPIVAAT